MKNNKENSKTKCPDTLKEIIKASNLVNFNVDLENESAVYKRVENEYLKKQKPNEHQLNSHSFFTPLWFAVYDECYKQFQKSYKSKYIKLCKERYKSAKSEEDFYQLNLDLAYLIFDKYGYIRLNRQRLLYLVEKFEQWRTGKSLYGESRPLLNFELERYDLLQDLPRPELKISVNDEGIIKTSIENIAEFAEAIKDVEFYRLRLCPICRKVYWASRLDSKTCDKKCSDVLSQRRYQNRNKDEINARRRKNYAIKKRSKENKEKIKNGNL